MIPGLRLAPGGVDREGIMAEKAPKSSAQPPPGVIRLRQSGSSLVGRRVSVLSDSPKVRVENVERSNVTLAFLRVSGLRFLQGFYIVGAWRVCDCGATYPKP
jgi:hypothetical protein